MRPSAPDAVRPEANHASRMRAWPRRTYLFRLLGMGLAALPISVVLAENDAAWPSWAWAIFVCFLWPHIAYQAAIRSADPLRTEKVNFLIDSMLAGSCLPLMHFNLLPSAVLVTVTCADKVNTGARGMLRRSLPGLLAAVAVVAVLTGFEVALPSSTAVVLACLPIMAVHTMAVSANMSQLVRRLQIQNVKLQELSERDALTGLANRRHWEAETEVLLRRHHAQGVPATLMLLDSDRFKSVNDRYGHGVGDDVLRAIADGLRTLLPLGCAVGRLGGDEFVVALPLPIAEAERIAETLRREVEAMRLERVPALRFSISIGLAEAPAPGLDLREWLEAADRRLYVAKQGGRNRTAACETER